MEKSRRIKQALAHKVRHYDPEALDRPPGERWITMTNALIRAGHGLSLAEKRLVMAAVSKLDSRKILPPGEVPTTRISAEEYAEIAGCSMPTAYEALQDASKQLYQRSITFYEPAFTRGKKALEPTRVTMRWVGQVHYQKGEGWVELY